MAIFHLKVFDTWHDLATDYWIDIPESEPLFAILSKVKDNGRGTIETTISGSEEDIEKFEIKKPKGNTKKYPKI